MRFSLNQLILAITLWSLAIAMVVLIAPGVVGVFVLFSFLVVLQACAMLGAKVLLDRNRDE